MWTTTTGEGLNKWIRRLVNAAGVKPTGKVRFHLIRKYTYDVATSQIGPYEAKLLVGKSIPIEDHTYLHGLEDRLLDRYKKFAYPFLKLNGTVQSQESKIEKLTREVEEIKLESETWRKEAIEMKLEIKANREARRESDAMMNQLFSDEEFREVLRIKLKDLV